MIPVGEMLKKHWLSQGVLPVAGVSKQDVLSFEAKFGVKMPADMREYFLTTNGLESDAIEGGGWFRFWPLEDLKPLDTEIRYIDQVRYSHLKNPSSYFCFADFMIKSEVFSIQMLPSEQLRNPVLGFNGSLRADCFTHFIEQYIRDPKSVLSGSAGGSYPT